MPTFAGTELEQQQQQSQADPYSSPVSSPERRPSAYRSPPLLGSRIKSPPRFPRSPSQFELLHAEEDGSGSAGSDGAMEQSEGRGVMGANSFMDRLEHMDSSRGAASEEEPPVDSFGIDIQTGSPEDMDAKE